MGANHYIEVNWRLDLVQGPSLEHIPQACYKMHSFISPKKERKKPEVKRLAVNGCK